MDDVSDIRAMYDADPDREVDRLNRHQLEDELTWRYLETYLPPTGHILEVGAAGGRYTLPLARRGYRVTAVDLSGELLRINRERAEAEGLTDRITYLRDDARTLGTVGDVCYHAALLMGPLYHLIYEADRLAALERVHALLAPGAPLMTAWICRYGCVGDVLRNIPEWIENQTEVRSVIERGYDPPETRWGQGFRGYFCRVEELAPLHERAGFETLAVAGVEPVIGPCDEAYNSLEGERRRLWLDLLYEISAEPSIVGASRHLLYVGRRSS